MNRARWQNAKEIFDRALDLRPEELEGYLRSACDGDIDLRHEVENLLGSYKSDFMEVPNLAKLNSNDGQLPVGTRLGRYEVIRLLGAGGMGEVYLAQDTKLDRKIAIKLMAAEFGEEVEKLGRFTQEARAAAALNHPNIAHVYEIGKTDGVNFIAMEYVDGETLGSWLSRNRPNISRQIEVAAQAAGALAAAHAAGIVHRDIKPDNLMIAPGPQLKILDFGLAKPATRRPIAVGTEDTTHALANTTPGMILGTVTYM